MLNRGSIHISGPSCIFALGLVEQLLARLALAVGPAVELMVKAYKVRDYC